VVMTQPATEEQSNRQTTWLLVTRVPVRSISFQFTVSGREALMQAQQHPAAVELAIDPQLLSSSARTLEVR